MTENIAEIHERVVNEFLNNPEDADCRRKYLESLSLICGRQHDGYRSLADAMLAGRSIAVPEILYPDHLDAIDSCLRELPFSDRDLLSQRYGLRHGHNSVASLAERRQTTREAIRRQESRALRELRQPAIRGTLEQALGYGKD